MSINPATHTSIEDIGARILRSWWFLGLVFAAVVILLALASWPWWFNRFVLKATTRIVEISASAPGVHGIDVNLPKSAELQIFGAHADGRPPELAVLGAADSVRLVVSSAKLQSISLQSGTGLVVRTTSDGGADLGVLNNGFISVALSGTIENIDGKGQRTTIANIERATTWHIRPAGTNPARLVLPPGTAPIALYNQPISDFWFRSPRPAGEDPHTFQSEILKGELQVLDTGTKVELEPRELVLLEGGNRVLSRLEIVDKAIAVDVQGDAKQISVGPPRPGTPFSLDRNLTPSVLSYLFGQHELKLLWGIAVAMMGGLWTARQWALKWRA